MSRATAAWPGTGAKTRPFRFGATRIHQLEPPLEPGVVLGAHERYRIDEFLGQGGMGRVYAATRLGDGADVALKVLRRDSGAADHGAEAFARFRLEAEAASRVGHEGIVRVLGFEQTPSGETLMAMERLYGESLEDWLDRPGSLSDGLGYLGQACEALHAAHELDIVHRDIKPANIFLARGSHDRVRAKVLDFGLAKVSSSEHTAIQTEAGAILGTPYYLAPERALGGEQRLDRRADLYSLGVVLYEMLTGCVPFEADNFVEILVHHAKSPPLDPRQANPVRAIPDALAELTMRLLAKDPAARPSSAAELAASLHHIAKEHAAAIGRVATGPRPRADGNADTVALVSVADRPTTAPDPASVGPMTSFAGAKTVAPAAAPVPAGRPPSASRWWIPVAIGTAVAAAVGAMFLLRAHVGEPEAAPPTAPVADAPDPTPAAVLEAPVGAGSAAVVPTASTPDPSPGDGKTATADANPQPGATAETPDVNEAEPKPSAKSPKVRSKRPGGGKSKAKDSTKPKDPAKPKDSGGGVPALKDDVYDE